MWRAFNGHGLCDRSDAWANGVLGLAVSPAEVSLWPQCFHLTGDGDATYANQFLAGGSTSSLHVSVRVAAAPWTVPPPSSSILAASAGGCGFTCARRGIRSDARCLAPTQRISPSRHASTQFNRVRAHQDAVAGQCARLPARRSGRQADAPWGNSPVGSWGGRVAEGA